MVRYWGVAVICVLLGAIGLAAWAQAGKPARVADDIRRVAFAYYHSTISGDVDGYVKACRFPLWIVHDGTGATRDEKQARALVVRIGQRTGYDKLSADEKKQIAERVIAAIDNADISFIGADTAAVTFATKPATGPADGESCVHLVVHRRQGAWSAIFECSDSTPVPAVYYGEPEPPRKH